MFFSLLEPDLAGFHVCSDELVVEEHLDVGGGVELLTEGDVEGFAV